MPEQPAAKSERTPQSAPAKQEGEKSAPVKKQKAPKSHSDVEQLQTLIISQEKELGQFQALFDKQEAKIAAQAKENQQLREQLKLSADENSLKQTIA